MKKKPRISKSVGIARARARRRLGRRPCETTTKRCVARVSGAVQTAAPVRQTGHGADRQAGRQADTAERTDRVVTAAVAEQPAAPPSLRNDFLKWRHPPRPRQLTFPATSARSASYTPWSAAADRLLTPPPPPFIAFLLQNTKYLPIEIFVYVPLFFFFFYLFIKRTIISLFIYHFDYDGSRLRLSCTRSDDDVGARVRFRSINSPPRVC